LITIVIIIMIIMDKTELFEPSPSIENSTRFYPVFTSLDFETFFFFFTGQGRQRFIQTATWRPGPCIKSPSNRVAQLYPQAPGGFSSPSITRLVKMVTL
jgi:hypothetical protein